MKNVSEALREEIAKRLGPNGSHTVYTTRDLAGVVKASENRILAQVEDLSNRISIAMKWWCETNAIVGGYRATNVAAKGQNRRYRFTPHTEVREEDPARLHVGATVEGEIKALKDDGSMLIEFFHDGGQLYKAIPLNW